MLTINAAASKGKLIELLQRRTQECFAHSISIYDIENNAMFSSNRGGGPLDSKKVEDFSQGMYWIIAEDNDPVYRHIQPATKLIADWMSGPEDYHLWFKGMLNLKEIEKLQFEEETKETWTPYLLLRHIMRYDAPVEVDGAFACIYSNGKDLFIFRNELENIYIDDDFSVSTDEFPGSKLLPANRFYKMDLVKKKLILLEEFTTVRHWI